MNKPTSHSKGLTLEEIATRRQALKIAIADQRKAVDEAYRQVVSPFTEAKSVTKYIGSNLLSDSRCSKVPCGDSVWSPASSACFVDSAN